MKKKPRYADIADGPEHERLAIIGTHAEAGNVVGFFVDDAAKADRYIKKLLRQYRVVVLWRGPGLVENTVMVKIGPRPTPESVH